MTKGIAITCKGADLLPFDAIEDFQGGLKKRSPKDIEQIIKSIEKYGFSFPFFVWKSSGHNYCLDGHGRIQALTEMRRRGVSLPLFPVDYIEAADEAEAKQKLLRMNSVFGLMTIDSIYDFMGDCEINFDELSIPDINFDEEEKIIKEPKEEILKPYTKIHVLISFEPDKFSEINQLLEKIKATEGIEYDQSAN